MVSPRVVLVTGGNNGIGYEIVKALLQSAKSYRILLGSRSLDKAKVAMEKLSSECPDTKNTVESLQVDLTSDESIEKAAEQVKACSGYIDTLVNNAGAAFDGQFVTGKMSLRESFTKAYDVNVAGTQVLTYTFMPLLLKSSTPQLIFISGLSSITTASQPGKYFPTPAQPAGWPKKIDFETIGYRCTKNALNMLMVDWNHKLKEDGVKVWCVAPGFLATDLGGGRDIGLKMGAGHPSAGGDIVRRVVEGERDEDTGKFVMKNGGILAW